MRIISEKLKQQITAVTLLSKLYFYVLDLFKWHYDGESMRERKRKTICWFIPQMPSTAEVRAWLKPRRAQSSHLGGRHPSNQAVTCCLPGCEFSESWSEQLQWLICCATCLLQPPQFNCSLITCLYWLPMHSVAVEYFQHCRKSHCKIKTKTKLTRNSLKKKRQVSPEL